ncbi:MAG: hypothetical protein ACKVK0_07545 [Pirellulales bacterium]
MACTDIASELIAAKSTVISYVTLSISPSDKLIEVTAATTVDGRIYATVIAV